MLSTKDISQIWVKAAKPLSQQYISETLKLAGIEPVEQRGRAYFYTESDIERIASKHGWAKLPSKFTNIDALEEHIDITTESPMLPLEFAKFKESVLRGKKLEFDLKEKQGLLMERKDHDLAVGNIQAELERQLQLLPNAIVRNFSVDLEDATYFVKDLAKRLEAALNAIQPD